MTEVRKGWNCEARARLAGAVRAADAVQVCPYGPTCGGRFLSGLRRAVVSKKGLQDVEGRKEKSGQKASSRLAEGT